MALGALGVAAAYADAGRGQRRRPGRRRRAGCGWPLFFLVLLTAGELFILPVGLGLFARLAPDRIGATTIAAWFFAAFGGNLLAGALGTLWSRIGHATFFAAMASLATLAALLLWLLDRPVRRLEPGNAGLTGQGVPGLALRVD